MIKKLELNIEDIKKLIPHRYPFLLVDKILNIVPFESATGIKNVTVNENFFQENQWAVATSSAELSMSR